MSKIYLASSWRNYAQPLLVQLLRERDFEVYDFRNPPHGDAGFSWREIDGDWENWSTDRYIMNLQHRVAQAGFQADLDGMKWADACVLLMPSGRSAALEAGWFTGRRKPVFVLVAQKMEPELMLNLAMCDPEVGGGIYAHPDQLLTALEDWRARQ